MKNELWINDKDAYLTWGVRLSDTSLAALMTPNPMKEYIENKSRLEHGKRVLNVDPKVDERSLTLVLSLTAKDKAEYLTRYQSFCQELEKGAFTLKTKWQDDVYHLMYTSCSSFTQYINGLAKISLKCDEPNPKNRS
jgi:hypothetical protein